MKSGATLIKTSERTTTERYEPMSQILPSGTGSRLRFARHAGPNRFTLPISA
jgi:hypothetical protein